MATLGASTAARSDAHAHAVRLRGPARAAAPALIVDVEDDDFLAVLQGALQRMVWPRTGWPAELPLPTLPGSGAPRALFQPIHRRFNLLLLDTHCDSFGSPRLDPRRIESAGFVVRRWVGPDASPGQPADATLDHPRHWQAWQQRGDQPLGWQPLADAREAEADPDPARRPLPRSGNATLDAMLAERARQRPAEAVHRLYPLPPALNDQARRTLLWGLVPASDSQRGPASPAVDYGAAYVEGAARTAFLEHLSPYLRRTASTRDLPAGRFGSDWVDATLQLPADAPDVAGAADLQRAQFTAFVRQLALEFDIAGPAAAPLRSLLDEVPLEQRRPVLPAALQPQGRGLGVLVLNPWQRLNTAEFVVACARVLTEPDTPAVDMPNRFGPVPAGWTDRFANAALALLEQRAATLPIPQDRFGDPQALYAARAFVRVRGHDGCPPQLVWSRPTPLYRIAPWYATADAPPARIALPPMDRDSLKAMKPNVAFDLPPALQSLLARNAPASLLEGKGQPGGGEGMGWLCSFSIPIITICAFILLNIVLALLDVFLRWMPFVKVCLPKPKRP
jgi:hypothetical protein